MQTRRACGIHVQVRLQEESKADVCELIGNLVENHYKQTGYLPINTEERPILISK